MKTFHVPLIISHLLLAANAALAAGKTSPPFEGTISATLTRAGTEANHFQFTRKGDHLRIENTTNRLEPINIIDLEAKKLTIVYPHNTTFVRIDLTKKQAQPNFPGAPAGMPPMPNTVGEAVNASPARTFPDGTTTSPPAGQIGPKISPPPGFPSPPPMPSMPQMPSGGMPNSPGNMPALPNPALQAPPPGVGPGANPGMGTSMPGMPPIGNPGMAMPMPPMPPMPGMFGGMDLKKRTRRRRFRVSIALSTPLVVGERILKFGRLTTPRYYRFS